MQIKVLGSGVDVGESLREFAVSEVSLFVEKYIGDIIEASVFIKKDRKIFTVEIVVHVSKGFVVKGDCESGDPYRAVSYSIQRLETIMKKHKNRMKDRKRRESWTKGGHPAVDYLLERRESEGGATDEEHLIIAEQEKYVLNLSIGEAVAKLDLSGAYVVMFKNIDNGRINVVYRRKDGHVGWIDYSE
ncbi:MAG: ribosome-associated translation inhibitor RaiA [Holosporales bacterium]|jgi:ribosomal subunit interface protein|nr:ribosome-associated translation inhibitor RaiA [Holosporales bacterium]